MAAVSLGCAVWLFAQALGTALTDAILYILPRQQNYVNQKGVLLWITYSRPVCLR